MTIRTIPYATRIVFGSGAIAQLPSVLTSLRIAKPLLLCDAAVRATGIEDQAVATLTGVAHERLVLTGFDEAALRKVARTAKRLRCDGLVAIGGGSVIDAAKIVSVCMASSSPLSTYSVEAAAPQMLPAQMPGVVCVPTTAGTGSDISRGAAVHSGARRLVLLDHALLPKATLCDPLLTLGLPLALTAATAVDALMHCVEGFLSPRCGPPFDAVAAAGIQRIVEWLPRCLAEPGNSEARGELMMGAIEGGISMPLGLGAVHGLAVPLDGPGIHHGTVVGILAPHVLNFYEDQGEPKIAHLRNLLRLRARKGAVGHAFTRLLTQSGLPLALPQAGITPALAEEAIRFAPHSPYHATSPVKPTPTEYARLLTEAMA